MTVALGTTLINLNIATLIERAEYERIEPGKTGSSTANIFIGAIVTRYRQTDPVVALCSSDQMIAGIVVGLDITQHTLPNVTSGNPAFYNDYDNPFAVNTYIRIGVLKSQGVYLVLSETNTTIENGDPLNVVSGGVLAVASTGANISFMAEEDVTGASNTRKYFRARFIRN